MPHTPSAYKRLRQNEVRRQRNLAAMRALKTSFQKAETALKADPAIPQAQDALKAAVAMLDRWSARGLMHRNTAARRKSRLMRLNDVAASAASAASARPAAAKAQSSKPKTPAKAVQPKADAKPAAKTDKT